MLNITKTDTALTTESLGTFDAQLKPEHDAIYQSSGGELSTNELNALSKEFTSYTELLRIERNPGRIERPREIVAEVMIRLEPYMEHVDPNIKELIEEITEQEHLKIEAQTQE